MTNFIAEALSDSNANAVVVMLVAVLLLFIGIPLIINLMRYLRER